MVRFRTFAAFLVLAGAVLAQEVSQSGLRLEAARPMVSQPVRAQKAIVASVHDLATQAGIDVLRRGGNAVDAAVAVGFVLGVVHPEAGNLGGSGYLLARMGDGRVAAFDYAGTAPTGSKPGMFATAAEANVGYKSIAVPGTVDGLGKAHARFGKLKWSQCLEPARRLAKYGFPASQRLELILKLQVPVMKNYPETAAVFLHGSTQPLKQDEIVKQPDLAATIKRLQQRGHREFYEGETARRIAADMQANGGLITAADLKSFQAQEVAPLRLVYRDHPVLTMPPSSSGGVALAVMLNVFERYPVQLGMEGSAAIRHLQVEAMRRGFSARGRALTTDGGVETMISDAFAAELSRDLSLERATTQQPAAVAPESNDTTHFTIIDGDGNIVTNTYTLSGFFGSQVIIKGTGVLMNNHMSVFTGAAARMAAPGRRYPSTMSPTILLRPDGTPLAALGTPGGATIPSTIFQVITNLVDFQMSLRDAVEFPRIHFQSGQIDAEPAALVWDVAEKLRAMGHKLNPRLRSQGDVQAVMVESGTGWRVGWSDGRRGGAIKGF